MNMKAIGKFGLIFSLGLFGLLASSHGQNQINWSLVLEQPGQPGVEVGRFEGLPDHKINFDKKVGDIQVKAQIEPMGNLVTYRAEAVSDADHQCFLSLKADFKNGEVYSYQGEVKDRQVLRQSPHDPTNHDLTGFAQQAVPMLAIKGDTGFFAAVNNTPALYDNYTTQTLNPKANEAILSSGDTGEIAGKPPKTVKIESYYHKIGEGKGHAFDGIIFKSGAGNLNDLRKDVLAAVAKRWGDHVTGRFGTTAFASNYMLLRKNETGHSRYWVVAGLDYSNKAYSRDSFWQSMVLPPEYARECYKNEAVAQPTGAERPLFGMIWAYRTKLEGGEPDMDAARKTLSYIEDHTKDGWYYSSNDKKRKNFQSWCDLVAFEEDDVLTYNQGLLAVALLSAEALGLKPTPPSSLAIKNYQSMFNEKGGYFPFSRQKDLLAVDPLVGDLLAQVYFKKALLSDASVRSHFKQIVAHAKTPYGFKVTCLPDGNYAPASAYDAKDFPGEPGADGKTGHYQWGGSWTLFDMLCLIDSHLHGARGALDELLWRGALDFKLGGTYFEHIDTVSGKTDKANQGWNSGIYAIWRKLMKQGRVDNSLLESVDKL